MWKYVFAALWALLHLLAVRLGLAAPQKDGSGTLKGDESKGPSSSVTPRSVNYHFTRKCNYSCGFCFHTATTSFYLPPEDAKQGLKLLQERGELRLDLGRINNMSRIFKTEYESLKEN